MVNNVMFAIVLPDAVNLSGPELNQTAAAGVTGWDIVTGDPQFNGIWGDTIDLDNIIQVDTGGPQQGGGLNPVTLGVTTLADYLTAHPPLASDIWTIFYDDNAGGSYQARSFVVALNFTEPGDKGIVVNADTTTPPDSAQHVGNDLIYGSSSGTDTLNGQDGNDTFVLHGANDTVNGGLGTNTLDLSAATGPVSLTLMTSASFTSLDLSSVALGHLNYANIQGVIGSNFADNITTGANNQFITGGGGADNITLNGNSETLIYRNVSEGNDIVHNFNTAPLASGGDIIDISSILQGTGVKSSTDAFNKGYLLFSGANGNNDTNVQVDPDAAGPQPVATVATLVGVHFTTPAAALATLAEHVVATPHH
jgi:hypothetical protein